MARPSKGASTVLAAFVLVSLTSQAPAQVAPPDAARTPGAVAGGSGAGRRDLVAVPAGQANPRPASEAPGAHAGAQARLAAEHAELDGAGYRAHFSRESVRVSKAEGGESASLGYRLTRATAGSAVLFDATAATHKLPAVAGPGALRTRRHAWGAGLADLEPTEPNRQRAPR